MDSFINADTNLQEVFKQYISNSDEDIDSWKEIKDRWNELSSDILKLHRDFLRLFEFWNRNTHTEGPLEFSIATDCTDDTCGIYMRN